MSIYLVLQCFSSVKPRRAPAPPPPRPAPPRPAAPRPVQRFTHLIFKIRRGPKGPSV